jgi:hypothetical protein
LQPAAAPLLCCWSFARCIDLGADHLVASLMNIVYCSCCQECFCTCKLSAPISLSSSHSFVQLCRLGFSARAAIRTPLPFIG